MNRNHTRRGHRLLIGVALAVAWISTGSGLRHDSVQAQDLCSGPNVNPIACENSKPGNPASQWDIAGAGSTAIQGFATDISVNRGQTIGFKVDTTATAFRIDIYRMGYYAGAGARLIATVPATATIPRNQPNCFTDTTTGLVDCGNWTQSASWAVPATATSGIYIAKLVSTAGGTGTNHIVFVVRDDTGASDILFQTSDTTWQAYNQYGGNSLYVGSPAGRAYEVSYNRPFTTRGTGPEDWVFNAEYPMVRWLEANGYNLSYSTGVDTDRRGAELLEHKVFMSVGHDEYWSGQQRANVEAARAAGVHLAFFSGNEVFWKTRWDTSIDGTATPYRTLVTYKETHANAKIDPTAAWTGTWRDPRFSPPADGGRPENALTGTIFTVNCCTYTITVPEVLGKMRLWRNTTVATLGAGQTATLAANTLGYEWDEDLDNGFRPEGLIQMSSTTVNGVDRIQDHGSSYGTGTATHSLTLYRHPSGALVFGAGTIQWSWGLDGTHDRGASTPDVRMRQATVNLLADMETQPSTLQSGLTAATASTDTQPPVTAITAPASGASFQSGATVTVNGTASDTGGVVAAVEVSVDGGATWRRATGRATWTLSFTAGAGGSLTIRSRGIDDSGNIENPGASRSILITGLSGLVAAYSFDEGSGTTTADLSGRGNAGTLNGATWTAGKNGNGLSFNGTSAMVTIADSASLHLTTAMTLEAWVRPTIVGSWRTVLMKERSGGLAYALYAHDTFRPAAWINTSGDAEASGGSALTPNVWTHLASTYDGATLRLYVNGALTASRPVTGTLNFGTQPLRIGGNTVWDEFFAGVLDDVRVYANVLTASQIVSDMNTPVGGTPPPDTFPPTVFAISPASGASSTNPAANVTVTFSEPMSAASISSATIELRDSANQLVAASVTYDAPTLTATLNPANDLSLVTTYTVMVRGGTTDPRVKDTANNAMSANFSWSFTTIGPPPNEGPGGPILVIASAGNPFTRYYAEILRAEGLNLFTVSDISLVTASVLNAYDVVILGEMSLTAAQVSMLTAWVNGGGNLIAMRPDPQLAGLLGLTVAAGTRANQYLLINPSGPGAGLVNQTIQFHGTANNYTLAGATSVATLYSTATTATSNPAATLRSVGASGGQAAAFSYDLARSIVYTRQGNPAWSGQERDGFAPLAIRSNDLFYGARAGDVQPDWVDLNKVAIPQADEQQRLLANLILQMSNDRKPLPRTWYLPRGLKAAVVMTGDDHAQGGTAGRWNNYKAASPVGCSVANWECVRATSYIYTNTPLTNAQAAAFTTDGFEVALHVNTDCGAWTPSQLEAFYAGQLPAFSAKYTSVPLPVTHRTHCITWSDYATQPKVELNHGIRFDTNYYYYPGPWVLDRPGFFTGSGIPMRFADVDGSLIDVYQATSQMTDEANQTFPFTIDTMLNRALGAEGYYGVLTANMHTDTVAHAGSDAIVASAQARGVPIVSSKQMLTWLDGRNNSTFSSFSWGGGTLTFTLLQGSGANGLQVLLPAQSTIGPLASITRAGSAVAFVVQTLKGISYATFSAQSGTYAAVYSGSAPPDTTITSSPASPTTSTSASFSFTSTPAGATFQCALDGAAFTACTTPQPYTGLAVGSHTFQVRAVNAAGTDATPASFTWTITAPVPPDTTITSSPASPTTSTSASFSFTSTPAGATFQCALDGAAFTACTTPQAYTGLAVGSHTFQVRAVSAEGTDPTPASFTWTITAPVPPDTTITSSPPASTTSTSASFSFTSTPAGATFECALDGAAFTTCVSPQNYTSLALGGHAFQVRAVNAAGTDPTPAAFNWTITAPVPPDTTITSSPPASTTSTSASFSFTSTPAGATFECSLDAAAFAACPSPQAYTSLAAGSHTFRVRAVNAAGTDATPASFTWTITAAGTCPCSIWSPTAAPAQIDDGDTAAVTVGMKFQADRDGYISGIRFYKGPLNTGTHVGSLWNTTGTLLANVTFTGETASGWQQANFGAPVAITAGTVYVASYHTPVGHYSGEDFGFNLGVDSPPLHALANSTSSNGVYQYGATSLFPNQTYNAENYWVDVVFVDTVGPDTTAPTVMSRSPAIGATGVATNSAVTAVFNEPIDAATVSGATVELQNAGGTLIAATVTYNSGSRTATLQPTALLTVSTTYTATIRGGTTDPAVKDVAGNRLAANVVWSFTTAATNPPVTVLPTSVTVETGTLRAGTVSSVSADDNVYYEVNSTTVDPRTSSWYASFTAPNAIQGLTVTYRGRFSQASCVQTVDIWRWTDSTWVQLDSRTVGTAEIAIVNLAVPGVLPDYVNGTSGNGEVRVRVRGTRVGTVDFFSRGDLISIAYNP